MFVSSLTRGRFAGKLAHTDRHTHTQINSKGRYDVLGRRWHLRAKLHLAREPANKTRPNYSDRRPVPVGHRAVGQRASSLGSGKMILCKMMIASSSSTLRALAQAKGSVERGGK